jgi:hypothetical protein
MWVSAHEMDARRAQEGGFPGLMPFVHSYLGTMNVDVDTHCKLTTYLNFVSKRASGRAGLRFARPHAEHSDGTCRAEAAPPKHCNPGPISATSESSIQ